MRTHKFSLVHQVLVCCALVAGPLAGLSQAAIEDAAGKTGELQVKLKDRCSLSSLAEISKRMSIKGFDYDLSKESFAVYVPKEAGPGGKYGLVVALPPQPKSKPPAGWEPVLDKLHLIWISTENSTDGRDPLQRVGLALDAAFNAQTTWQIDQARVFLFNCANDPPVSAMEMYYADVFDGTLQCNTLDFFTKIADSKQGHGIAWKPRISKPSPEILEQAKNRRFFFIDKIEDRYGDSNQTLETVTSGYQKTGFKALKTLPFRTEIQGKYTSQPADWFEAGMVYLDVKPESPAVALAKAEGATEAQASAAPAQPTVAAAPVKEAPKPAATTSPMKEPAKPTAAAAPPPPPPPPVVETPADKAARAINLVKSYIAAQRYDIARSRLQRILTDYPDTPSAKEATALLKEIQDK